MPTEEEILGQFEGDFQNAQKAEPVSSIGRIPEGTYKLVLTSVDLAGDGRLVDHDLFDANTGSTGFKVFAEVLEPETIEVAGKPEPVKVKGEILEHVFWLTQKFWPYLKRDVATIIGKDLSSAKELAKIVWAGKTFEGVVQDESRDGFVRSRIRFINPWKPEQKGSGQAAPTPTAQTETKKLPARRKTNGGAKATAPASQAAPTVPTASAEDPNF